MKNALVIGASSGIGRDLAVKLAENGFQVAITARREGELQELGSQYPRNMLIHAFDCRDLKNTRELDHIAGTMGSLQLLILSAGNGEINKTLDFEIERETNTLNVQAFTEICCWAFRYFSAQKGGHLAVITSVAGLRGGRTAPAYNASKSYQIKYLEGLRQKAHKANLPLYITDIRPGFVDTAMAKGGRRFWVVPRDKAAAQIYRHISNRRQVAYVSRRWLCIAWLLKIMPPFVYRRL